LPAKQMSASTAKQMIDRGSGIPVVLVPGLQGRWEWYAAAVEALARRCRVITYSLGSAARGIRADAAEGIDVLSRELEEVLDRANVGRALVCGVSFGGRVALRFAASRPERVAGLALVSTPGPRWRANARVRRHVRWPRLLTPWFVITAPARVVPEILTALPRRTDAAAFAVRHALRVLAAPMAPTEMAARVLMLTSCDAAADCARLSRPTLVVTGDSGLDKVVAVEDTCEYVQTIRGARHIVLHRTGHIGLVTQPELFADVIGEFAESCWESGRVSRGRQESRNRRDAEMQRPAEELLVHHE
jgi:pimeloyl-ACP methyl ester carboxylesterase